MPRFEGDPYEQEYAKIVEIEVVREGTWNNRFYGQEFIEDIAASYDLSIVRAPVIFGHGGFLEPEFEALGHILALQHVDEKSDKGLHKVIATVGLLDSGVETIESGEANERSISWWDFYPLQGIPYMLHLALLGNSNPAVVGMDPIVFSVNNVQDEIDAHSSVQQTVDSDRIAARANLANMIVEQLPESTNLNWARTDEDISYKVRELSRFQSGTLRTRQISSKSGIRAEAGLLKKEYVPEGKKNDAVFNRVILFSREKGWTFLKAKAWVEGKASLSAELTEPDNNEVEIDVKINVETNVKEGTDPVTETVDGSNTSNILTATAEGGPTMPDVVETAAPVDGHEGDDAPVESTQPTPVVTATTVSLIEPESIDDLQKKTDALRVTIDAEKSQAQQEYEKLFRQLQEESFKNRKAKLTAISRTMLSEGFIVPAHIEGGIVECLSAIPDELEIELQLSDGNSVKRKVSDQLFELFKLGGRVKLKGEVSAHTSIKDDTKGPNADLDRLDASGFDTTTERLRRKLSEEYPDKNATEIMVMVEKLKESDV